MVTADFYYLLRNINNIIKEMLKNTDYTFFINYNKDCKSLL